MRCFEYVYRSAFFPRKTGESPRNDADRGVVRRAGFAAGWVSPSRIRNGFFTASGKKRVGVRAATRIGAEVISLDSIKVYRGMDIGSAKPGPEDRGTVPFHLLDILDPGESFSVGQFLTLAEEKLDYHPKVTLEEGLTLTLERDLRFQ